MFSPMPAKENYHSANIAHRCFTTSFGSMQKHLVKNTIIMRIMDLNLAYGSHYINTFNYSNMESDVQEAIRIVRNTYHISKEDVVLYGGSKGGTGALYHSLLGDYNSVTVDPIISLEQYNQENDLHFLRDFRKTSIFADLVRLAESEANKRRIIFGYPLVSFNYNLYTQIPTDSIEIRDTFDSDIHKHADISRNTIVEQITCINELLLSSENLSKILEQIRALAE
ncbi:XcbB/CpsF family capsular polysaccharide biosynthesis protein [Listeria portnoyi]|uniref:XcbB/CpsF family capsular polysaccharide biosynthesis protein n=1 Tax=Listeria portnoyi TaxID=2713504 RepID=UPI0031B594A2